MTTGFRFEQATLEDATLRGRISLDAHEVLSARGGFIERKAEIVRGHNQIDVVLEYKSRFDGMKAVTYYQLIHKERA